MIYLDHNATSPMAAEVLAAMEPWFGVPGNPASAHRAGQNAAMAVDQAREQVAALVGGEPNGVVFTSGATEANHLHVRGYAATLLNRDKSIALSDIEHPCVKAASEVLCAAGIPRDTLMVDATGKILLPDVPGNIGLLCMMGANHETGVIQPVQEAIQWCRDNSIAIHVDATQAAGRIPLDLSHADGVVLSSHKIGGPGGVGALVLPHGELFPPLLSGGSQERGRRAGTVYTAGVVGFGKACEIAKDQLQSRTDRWRSLRKKIVDGVTQCGGRVVGEKAVENTVCVVFAGFEAESIVQAMDLKGVCLSAGAACSSGSLEPSPVLRAMGISNARSGIRISMGPDTTDSEISEALAHLGATLQAFREAMLIDLDEGVQ